MRLDAVRPPNLGDGVVRNDSMKLGRELSARPVSRAVGRLSGHRVAQYLRLKPSVDLVPRPSSGLTRKSSYPIGDKTLTPALNESYVAVQPLTNLVERYAVGAHYNHPRSTRQRRLTALTTHDSFQRPPLVLSQSYYLHASLDASHRLRFTSGFARQFAGEFRFPDAPTENFGLIGKLVV